MLHFWRNGNKTCAARRAALGSSWLRRGRALRPFGGLPEVVFARLRARIGHDFTIKEHHVR